MKYCKLCLQPDTRPNIYFDENQICGACLWEKQKKLIDWDKRLETLKNIAEWAKSKNAPYDCVVGVSGGKDSTFQALYVKEKLKLHPLLVNSVPDEITDIGRANLQNLSNKGFDLISISPNPVLAKKLARTFFFNEGNLIKPSEYALWTSAYLIAEKFNIPLIIQGENAALTLGVSKGMKTDGDALGVINLSTLNGGFLTSFLDQSVEKKELFFYDFPDNTILINKDIRAIWLQYYAQEWSQVRNADFSIARGLKGRDNSLYDIGRYRRFTALDSDLSIVNQMFKYYKFGFGFTTDEACYDIREGRLTRDEATWLVKEYDGRCGQQFIELACRYMDISEETFWSVLDTFVNKNLFTKNAQGKWLPKFNVGEDFEE